MKRLASLVAVLALALASCVPLSVNPIYTGPEDLVEDPGLPGSFADEQGKTSWVFSKGEEPKSYTLRVIDEHGRTGVFTAHLVKIGERRFLDLEVHNHEPELEINGWIAIHLFAMHSFLRVEGIDGEALTIRLPSLEAVTRHLKSNANPPAYVVGKGDRVALTGGSAEVKKFLADSMSDDALWNEPTKLKRVAGATTRPETPK